MKRIATQEAVKLRLRMISRGTSAWVPARRSIGTKASDQDRRHDQQPDHFRVAPAPVVDLVEGDQQRDQPDRDRRDPRVVDPLVLGFGLLDVDQEVGDGDGEDRDRDVEEEDPAPAQGLGEDAADQRPDRVAEPGGAEDDPARQPRLVFGQDREGHAEDRRPHQGAADPHQGAGGDQPGLRRRRAARGPTSRRRSRCRGRRRCGGRTCRRAGRR